MNNNFHCKSCNHKFTGEGEKQEFIDPTFGPCFKYTATCPICGKESGEYQAPKQSAKAFEAAPSCGAGGCCCQN